MGDHLREVDCSYLEDLSCFCFLIFKIAHCYIMLFLVLLFSMVNMLSDFRW